MVEYLNVINKNLKNKSYFSGLINRHQNLKNKSQHKKEAFEKLGLICVCTVALISLVLLLVFPNAILMPFIVACIIACMFVTFLGELIGKQEIKYMDEIEDEFFSDLKKNHELIKDLSTLVINDDTEKSFNCIVDNLVQDNDDNTFDCFHNLLLSYDFVQSEADTVNERNDFLQKLKIDVSQKSEEKDTQESFQVKARGRVLKML